jgi:hypothetical protein
MDGDRVFTKGALERRNTVHRFDAVMSHGFIVVAYAGIPPK